MVCTFIYAYLINCDVSKNTTDTCRVKAKHIATFEKFIQSLKIERKFNIGKASGLIKSRDFTKVELNKIQRTIQLQNIVPGHPKLKLIQDMWAEFSCIMTLLREKGE